LFWFFAAEAGQTFKGFCDTAAEELEVKVPPLVIGVCSFAFIFLESLVPRLFVSECSCEMCSP
jgi:hypothetical protein